MKQFAAIILILAMTITPFWAEEGRAEERTAQDIIEELAVYYGTYGEEAEEKNAELLEELSKVDPVQGTKWESIYYETYNIHELPAMNPQ